MKNWRKRSGRAEKGEGSEGKCERDLVDSRKAKICILGVETHIHFIF